MRKRPDPVSRWTVPDNPAMHWTDPPSLPPPSPPRSAPAAGKTGSDPSPQRQHGAATTPSERKPIAPPAASPPKRPPAATSSTPSTPRVPKKHPGGRETLLTPERQQRIISYIRAGAFDWVAAEANGIHRQTFWEWIKRGEDAHARPQTERYAEFAYAVREARAEARLSAEVEVKRGEPLSWLMKGPGRDRPGEPGWTDRPSQDALPHVTIILAGDGKV